MLKEYPIIAKNLTAKAGFRKILDDVTFALKSGEFVGVIGGSGSGKSTLITCLNGYREPDGGTVLVNGVSAHRKKEFRHLVGYVPQDDIVHGTLSVERALYYACQLRAGADIPEDKIAFRVGKVLYQLGLTDQKNKKITSLSGGQRKRVSIGVELLHAPSLFFLDEPTAGLDPSLERQLMRLLASLKEESRLVMLTTHLMQHVSMFDVLLFIHRGKMVYFGPSDEITRFFGAEDMIDLFDRVMAQDPGKLSNAYLLSSLNRDFLTPRMRAASHV